MSSISMKWDRKMTARPILQKRRNILKLINLYRGKRVLWDRSLASFEDRRARKAAWKDISKRLPCPDYEVRQKMYTLIRAYERERKKEMCPFCCRKNPREIYRSKWFAYNSFDFLRNVKPRPRSQRPVSDSDDDNLENENEIYRNAVFIKEEPGAFEEEDVEYDGDDSNSAINMDRTDSQRSTIEFVNRDHNYGAHFLAEVVQSSPPRIPVRKVTVLRRKRPSLDEVDPIRSNATSAPVLDECSTFADHVKTKLEKFDGPNRAIIMHLINGAIFDAEMKKYGQNDFQFQPEGMVDNSVSVDPTSIPVERTWLEPVLCIPKLDIDDTNQSLYKTENEM